MFWYSLVLLTWCASAAVASTGKSDDTKLKLVIDNDAGVDDAMAIIIALLYEKHFNGPQVLGLVTTHGNTLEENVNINNQRILQVAKRQEVPIFRGSVKSLVISDEGDHDYFGQDGLGDTGELLKGLVPAQAKGGVQALLDYSKEFEGDLIVVTIGPLTNVALAISLDPNFLSRLSHLYVAAGHIHNENNPDAEYNAKGDVEAYRIVADAATPDKVTVLPFSVVMDSLNITQEWRLNTLGVIPTDIMKALNQYEKQSQEREVMWHMLDPAALAVALRRDLILETKLSKNNIILCGDKRGLNTNDFSATDDANVNVIHSINDTEYKQFFIDVFSSEIDKTTL